MVPFTAANKVSHTAQLSLTRQFVCGGGGGGREGREGLCSSHAKST